MTDGDLPLEIKAVVFDLDGLMLNTEDVFDLAGKAMLARRGLTMTDQIHHSMLGRRPDEAFQALKDLTGIKDSIEHLKDDAGTIGTAGHD
jgi:beta-phosphoglucomutase-like phosphatase (HAD superfamily)